MSQNRNAAERMAASLGLENNWAKAAAAAFFAIVLPYFVWSTISTINNNIFRETHQVETKELCDSVQRLVDEMQEVRDMYHTLPNQEWKDKVNDTQEQLDNLRKTNAAEHSTIVVSQAELATTQRYMSETIKENQRITMEALAEIRQQIKELSNKGHM